MLPRNEVMKRLNHRGKIANGQWIVNRYGNDETFCLWNAQQVSRIHNQNKRHFPSIFRPRLTNIRRIELSARSPFHSQWFFFDRNNAGARVLSPVRDGPCTKLAARSFSLVRVHIDIADINWGTSCGCPSLATAPVSFGSTKIGLSNLRRHGTERMAIFCWNYTSGSTGERTRSTCNNYLLLTLTLVASFITVIRIDISCISYPFFDD